MVGRIGRIGSRKRSHEQRQARGKDDVVAVIVEMSLVVVKVVVEKVMVVWK